MIKAHEIERSLGWVGIACEPGLPEIDGLWNWDVVVCFPIPRKAGKVKTMPAVAWNVPDTNVIIHEAGKGWTDERSGTYCSGKRLPNGSALHSSEIT